MNTAALVADAGNPRMHTVYNQCLSHSWSGKEDFSERQGGISSPKGPLPISMVLRSGRSLKSEMLSLTRTSKYVKSTSVLSIKKLEEAS